MVDPEQRPPGALRRSLVMACIIIAGEAIFCLPFHVARFFRPTVLKVFGLSNTALGKVQAAYGVVAMVAYFPGGPLADRFPARKLLTVSLVATALGGLYFATIPPVEGMYGLFAFMGASTILLFWAAMIRATREWGGDDEQGQAFGILDAGRGITAAALASLAVLIFGLFFPADPAAATNVHRTRAIRNVIYTYSGITLLAGALVWFLVLERPQGGRAIPARTSPWSRIVEVARLPTIWVQALIIICAYVGYKGLDNYSLFAVECYGMDEVEGARVSAMAAWVRPFAAFGFGLLGDRIRSSRASGLCFALMLGCYAFFAATLPSPDLAWVLWANILITCAGVFGLRGIYFALFEEGSIPPRLTGTATGMVSVLGYTPDIFVSPIAGWLLDRSPGLPGHQHFFTFMAAFAALGLLASAIFTRTAQRRDHA